MSKRMVEVYKKKNEFEKLSNIKSILEAIKSCCSAKFKESIDISIKLGINAKKTDENIRGTFILPNGVEKKIRIAAFVTSLQIEEAKNAGADFVGLDDLVEEIKKTEKINFDVCFASIEALPKIISIAKILGTNGVMPNKKDGTVTANIGDTIRESKEGRKCLFRNDSAGYLHISVGKADTATEKIEENIKDFINYVRTLKPPKVKEMVKKVHVSSTMGIGMEIPLKML